MFLFDQDKLYEEACQKFTTAMAILGYQPQLSYNIALCHYQMKQYAPALKHIADIIERGIREHPGIYLNPLLFCNVEYCLCAIFDVTFICFHEYL